MGTLKAVTWRRPQSPTESSSGSISHGCTHPSRFCSHGSSLSTTYTLQAATPVSAEPPSCCELVGWLLGVGIWADLHSYLTHRMMHSVPILYARVHKVHHRSYNTDPWSGLSMHPLEHIIYFSGIMLALCIPGTPFWATNWFRIALLIYPIPSHIGYYPFEKFHWIHHTEFNYNYGSGMLWDILFGTTHQAIKASAATNRDTARAREADRQRKMTIGSVSGA